MENMEVSFSMDEEEGRSGKRGRKVFWGIVFIVAAIVFLANKLGYLGGLGKIGIGTIVLSVALAAFLIDGVFKRSFGKIMFSLAFLIIVNDELLGLEAITPWPVLLAACALTVGLNMLFPHFGRRRHAITVNGKPAKAVNAESHEGDNVFYENAFGSTVKYISGNLAVVNMENSFGSMEVYFNNAVLVNNTARANVETSFGAVALYVPSEWKVMMDVETSFGVAEETGRCNPLGENTLYVEGEVSFGGLEIKYI